MSTNVERLLYYDREYLRSFDFQAEQNYHLEMRRRLNLALHRWGIVEGLELKNDDKLVPDAPPQVYLTPGMAVDAYGREIVVFAPFVISEEYLNEKGVSTGGTYSVWLAYQRGPSTPPSPGYALCDQKDQYTRWRESFEVLIKDSTFAPPDPANPPEASSELFDDPKKAPWPVKLGQIQFNPGAAGPAPKITVLTKPEDRTYIGLRAQRMVAPRQPGTGVFDVLAPNSSLNPPASIGIEANLFAEQNLIVGDDFQVKDIQPPPALVAPATYPNPTGNVKVTSDLFLNGNLYANVGGQFLGLSEYIKTFLPEIQFHTADVKINPGQTDPSNGTEPLKVSSKNLAKVSKAEVASWIAGVQWNTKKNVDDILAKVGNSAQFLFNVKSQISPSGPSSAYDVELKWSVGPTAKLPAGASTEFRSAIVSLTITCVVVFHP